MGIILGKFGPGSFHLNTLQHKDHGVRQKLVSRSLGMLALATVACLCTVTGGAQAVDFAKGANTWAASKTGDWVEYRLSTGQTVRYEVISVAEAGVTYARVTRGTDGTEIARNETTRAANACPMQGKPGAGARWETQPYAMAGQSLACLVASWVVDGSNGAIWYHAEVPCGGIVKTTTDNTDSVWLTAYSRNGTVHTVQAPTPEPKPEPKPEPRQPKVADEYGAPLTMALPEKVRQEMLDQGVAITRMRVYFTEGNTEDGISVEYEGMRTEVPVIFAGFKAEECDREVPYDVWKTRDGHFVDLAMEIKTLPSVLTNMKVKVEHSHFNGDVETVLNTFDVVVPDQGDPWDSLRFRGSRPGVNRFTMLVSYTNSAGLTTAHRGFSHWVVVQAPPMFEFNHRAAVTATRAKAGETTLLSAEVRFDATFTLHQGLKPQDCSIRVSRKGERSLNLGKLSPAMRRLIQKEKTPPGWQELGRVAVNEGTLNGRPFCVVKDGALEIQFTHGLQASSETLPLGEHWEYRFELFHKESPVPLATWMGDVDLDIANADAINSATIKVNGSAIKKPIEAAFAAK